MMIATALLYLQQAADDPASPLGVSSFWELVGYAQGFEYPIGLVFVVGLYFICTAYIRALYQWRRHRMLSRLNPETASRKTLDEALHQTPPANPYRIACEKMLGNHPRTLTYVLQYIDLDHERYREVDRYINAAVYVVLSLGLLGTLLGIFVLFTSSGRHETSDLVGLGIAVVSTLLALVVRLILWPANLLVQAWVRRRYHHLKEWCTAMALAMTANTPHLGHDGQATIATTKTAVHPLPEKT